jgi:transforming growth factor-beta-induced protein
MKKMIGSFAVLGLLVFAGCSEQTTAPVDDSSMLEKKPGTSTIVEIAASNPDFSYLVAAVQFAGLDGVLSSNRQLTVFAPVNSAFEQLAVDLGAPNVGAILVEENRELVTNVLLYHVAPGERYAKNVLAAGKVNTLANEFAYIKLEGEDAYIGSNDRYAKILATDIRAKNGVVHVIDRVILP